MKRFLFLSVLLAGSPCVSFALDPPDTAALLAAEREAAEEREKKMNARIEGVEETVALMRKHLTRLDSDMRNLRDEIARLNSKHNDTTTKENLDRLAKSIEEVDRKRQSDNEKVLAALTALQKGVEKGVSPDRAKPPVVTPPTVTPPTPPRGNDAGKGQNTPPPDNSTGQWFEYTIKKDDTLSGIVAKMRKLNYKVTQKQMEDANPGVDWNRLKIGTTLKIYAQPP